MKKIAIFSVMALALGLVSCSDYDNYDWPNPPAQSNAQGEIFDASTLVLTATDQAQAALNLPELNADNTAISLDQIDYGTFPVDDYTLSFVAQVAKSADFSKYGEAETTITDDGILTITPDALGAAIQDVTLDPRQTTVYVRYVAYAFNDNTTGVRIGGPNYYYGPQTLTVLPLDAYNGFTIDDSYTLVLGGAEYTMSHSSESPYDDPVFSASISLSPEEVGSGLTWYIKGVSGSYGPEDSAELTGDLLSGKTGLYDKTGDYLLTVNMGVADGDSFKRTYTFSPAFQYLYTPGASNGWNQASSQLLTTNDFTTYTGYAYLTGDFKFTSQADWNGTNYGSTGVAGELTTDGSAGNLSVDAAALYWCSVNIANLTYSLTEITTIGVIGGFNGWGESVALTPSDDFLVWEGDVDFGDGGEWKFRANDDWGINLGGDMLNLVQDGGNLTAPAGKKHITLDLSIVPYACYLD